MTNEIRRLVSAAMRWVRVRPPQGHMQSLRDVVDRRETDRLAQAAATDERQAREGAARDAER